MHQGTRDPPGTRGFTVEPKTKKQPGVQDSGSREGSQPKVFTKDPGIPTLLVHPPPHTHIQAQARVGLIRYTIRIHPIHRVCTLSGDLPPPEKKRRDHHGAPPSATSRGAPRGGGIQHPAPRPLSPATGLIKLSLSTLHETPGREKGNVSGSGGGLRAKEKNPPFFPSSPEPSRKRKRTTSKPGTRALSSTSDGDEAP